MSSNTLERLRNRKGEGTFSVKSNGKYEFRFTYEDIYGVKKRKSVTAESKDECYDKAEQFLCKVLDIRFIESSGFTISDVLKNKYESDYNHGYINQQGYARSLEALKIIERHAIGAVPVRELTSRQIDLFLMEMRKYSNSIIQKSYSQIKLALKIAVETKITDCNVIEENQIRCPKSVKQDKVVRAFTEQEQEIFEKALDMHKVPYGRNSYKNQMYISLYSGLRMGEVNALKREDIDFKNRMIHVRRTVSRDMEGNSFIKDGTKTETSKRDVPISTKLEKILKTAVEEQKKNPEGLLFYNYNTGHVVSTTQVNCFFKRICAKAGLDFTGQHMLRHTFATRCLEAGVEPVTLKTWLGHKDIHMTLDIYSNVFDRMNNSAIEKFNKYMGENMEKNKEIES